MLPDFPKLKKKIQNLNNQSINNRIRMYNGLLNYFRKISIPEGNTFVTIQENGNIKEGNFEKIESNKVSFDPKEIEKMTPEDISSKYDELAKSFAESQSKMIFERIDESAREVGNIFDAQGKKLTFDDILSSLEKIQIDFDESGNYRNLVITVSPDLLELLTKIILESEKIPENKKRFDEMIERKREEWRVRESNRKLVG